MVGAASESWRQEADFDGRARKPMIAEGFVVVENMLRWRITSKGEQAAKSGTKGR
jgi:hypothetical protein